MKDSFWLLVVVECIVTRTFFSSLICSLSLSLSLLNNFSVLFVVFEIGGCCLLLFVVVCWCVCYRVVVCCVGCCL